MGDDVNGGDNSRNATESGRVDDLSRLQSKLDDLGVMFYTYLGILQRDAPPIQRPPEEADEIPNDDKMRNELREKVPTFARDIINTSREIEMIIADVDKNVRAHAGNERHLLDSANFQSMQAGEEMSDAIDEASKLLTGIRDIIAAREDES